jgi:glycosyltransferase involved in cell wall biosynthesis
MIKICFVSGNIYPLLIETTDVQIVGGAEVQQYLIGTALPRQEFSVSFITEDFGQGAEIQAGEIKILAYSFGKNKLKQAFTLWKAMQRADADIYYVRSLPKFGRLIFIFCRINRRKLVNGLASNTEIFPRQQSKWIDNILYQIQNGWRASANWVVAQTEFQAKMLKTYWNTQSSVIPNVIRVESKPKAINLNRPLNVLWVGRLDPVKRIEILAEIVSKMPEIQFTVVGGANRNLEAYYDHAREQMTSHQNVQWNGYVPYNQVEDFFDQADILLHTGENGEGFPNVFLQAWSKGIPVISMESNPDEVINRFNLGFCSNSTADIINYIGKFNMDRHLLTELGRNSYQYVSQFHDISVILPQYIEVFYKLAK